MERILVYHTPGPNGGSFRYVKNPTTGDIYLGRQRGAFLIKRVVERRGNRLYGAWVTDDGSQIVVWEEDVQVPSDSAHSRQ